MYSYEERMRAVELYIKLGKRARATICQLGYPSKNALKGWCREYECRQDLRSGFAPRPPKFSEAQKQIALQHFAAHGRCISWTMRGEWTEHGGHAGRFLFATVSRPSRTAALVTATR